MASGHGHEDGIDPSSPAALTAMAALETDLDALAGAAFWQLGDHDLAELALRLERCRNRLDATRLAALQRMEARGTASTLGATSTTAWVAAASNLRHAAVRSDVGLAAALHESWPLLHAAVRSGTVSIDQARVCVKGLEALPPEVDTDTLDRAEAHLVELCADYDPARLAKLCRHLLAVIDPDGPEELEAAEQAATRKRELQVRPTRDGGLKLTGWFDTEGAASILTALDPLAAPRPSTAEGPDLRTPAARNADALVELARQMMNAGSLPTQGQERPHVTVTVDLATLRGAPHVAAAELERGGALSPEAARRIACDAKVIPVVLNGEGMPLDVGREQRTVPRHLRRALVVRDRGCAFGGCGRPPAWCDAHHIIHWADGGATALHNLVLLCGYHHNVLHHTGWTVAIGPDGQPVFTAPTRLPGDPARTRRNSTQLGRAMREVAIPPEEPPAATAATETDGEEEPRGP